MSDQQELVSSQTKSMLTTTVGEYQNQLLKYLSDLGLPNKNVLVDVDQRFRVIRNIPELLKPLSQEKLNESFYISKFIAACGSGLFDVALNYLWNETIKNLRYKVGVFDLEYFKSTISDEAKKNKIKSVEDLTLIDEWELVRGCNSTGIISDIGFKHLDYIRYMRNWASAAHPNQVQLTGVQLCSWLETCINEVIGKEPSSPAIEAKKLLQNIRDHILTEVDLPPIKTALRQAPSDIISSIFKTIFGMFCDPDSKVEIRNNSRLIANILWEVLPEIQRKEAGLKYANWSANADILRRDLSREFLEQVDALSYLPEDTLTLELDNSIELLQKSHIGTNNFYNEPPYARMLRKLVPDNGNIPDNIRFKYTKTICLCMIGNGYGVSDMAYPVYKDLFNKFTDNELKEFLKLFFDSDFKSRINFPSCREKYKSLLETLIQRTTDESIKRLIEHINSRTDEQLPGLGNTTEYKRMIELFS